MLGELKAAPLLNGFRGAAKTDIAALAQLIAQISQLAAQYRGQICRDRAQSGAGASEGQGVTIVDALVVRRRLNDRSRAGIPAFALASTPRHRAASGRARSPSLEIGDPAFLGGLDAFLEILGRAQPCLFGELMVGGGHTRSARPARMVARVESRPSGEHSAISAASFMASART